MPEDHNREIAPDEVARQYAALDERGRMAVLAVLATETKRCQFVAHWDDDVEVQPLPTAEK